MSRQVMDITIREQLKSIRLRRRRKELGIEDLLWMSSTMAKDSTLATGTMASI